MSWMNKLADTYDNSQQAIGAGNESEIPLLPICHTTQQAQIEIILNSEGIFKDARVVAKQQSRTIIPCTETSGTRANVEAPHPLCDKLQYIAPDYKDYGGEKKGYFASYRKLLTGWCESEHSHPKARVVLRYVNSGTIISDLVRHGVLFTDAHGQLLRQWDQRSPGPAPDIFKAALPALPSDSFVRWIVELPGDNNGSVWLDRSLYTSWQNYYISTQKATTLCYVTGQDALAARLHPAKIRHDGDKARLISSNDTDGFTYRGKFTSAEQAAGVSYAITQKAHNALRWLIGKQGYRQGDLAIVAWSTSRPEQPRVMRDMFSLKLAERRKDMTSQPAPPATSEELAHRLNRMIAGYRAEPGAVSNAVVVLGLDSATTGRLAVIFYRELNEAEFWERVKTWHMTCSWNLTYLEKGRYIGVPSPHEIVDAAYGSAADDKLRKSTIKQLLSCIIDGEQFPRQLVESAVRRATQRTSFDSDMDWEKAICVACALYRKYSRKGYLTVELNEQVHSRDYWFGVLLAFADYIERLSLKRMGEDRLTNAVRSMPKFVEQPATVWLRLYTSQLLPYIERMGHQASEPLLSQLGEAMTKLQPSEISDDKRLNGEFLLGYHSQLIKLRADEKKADSKRKGDNKNDRAEA